MVGDKNGKCTKRLQELGMNPNPTCMPDDIEKWFVLANDFIKNCDNKDDVKCILARARDVKKICDKPYHPITQLFISPALKDVLDTAKSKLDELDGKTKKQGFSFGGMIQRTTKKDDEKTLVDSQKWWEDLIEKY